MKLNLGCGRIILRDYVNVDYEPPADEIVDLESFPWPWEESSIEEIRMSHILEHLREPWDALRECHRILKPRGRLEIMVPHWRSPDARNLGHRTYWDERSLRPILADTSYSSEFHALFRAIFIHFHFNWKGIWHLDRYLPICEWRRLPLGPLREVHFLLENIKEI